jgi:hypothetical protein
MRGETRIEELKDDELVNDQNSQITIACPIEVIKCKKLKQNLN